MIGLNFAGENVGKIIEPIIKSPRLTGKEEKGLAQKLDEL